jgi:hypothetical protein
MIDNASYHRDKDTMEVYKELKIPILLTAPYSPNCCAVEMVFGALKRGEHNPLNNRTSKK